MGYNIPFVVICSLILQDLAGTGIKIHTKIIKLKQPMTIGFIKGPVEL